MHSQALTESRDARQRFPAGLLQPEGCARFGMDALLLAAFAARSLHVLSPAGRAPVLDLGCGVGAALLAVALLEEHITALGVEHNPELTQAAEENILRLGLAGRLHVLRGTLPAGECLRRCRDWLAGQPSGKQGAALVLANPPYWMRREGRTSSRALVETARRDTDTTLDAFCLSAAALTRHKGYFCCIYDARMLPRLFEACARHRLGIRRLLPVHPRKGQPAGRILLEARKGAAHELHIEEALYLHPSNAEENVRWTPEALQFCPFLGRPS